MFIVFLHILCYDLWYYLSHIILHNPNVYFIHKIHHSSRHNLLTYVDTKKGHYIEHVIQPLGIFVPCIFFGLCTNNLAISFSIVVVRNFMKHDHRCSWLIGNHHLLHHKHPKFNFGEYWIDEICSTRYPYKDEYIYGKLYT
jgi:sterol desaturase/sphingolipid hydroxylase (fatty acid hydroxylase superfamily)